jgi:hypothetical protein
MPVPGEWSRAYLLVDRAAVNCQKRVIQSSSSSGCFCFCCLCRISELRVPRRSIDLPRRHIDDEEEITVIMASW